jgi:hypothetical protein
MGGNSGQSEGKVNLFLFASEVAAKYKYIGVPYDVECHQMPTAVVYGREVLIRR